MSQPQGPTLRQHLNTNTFYTIFKLYFKAQPSDFAVYSRSRMSLGADNGSHLLLATLVRTFGVR